MIILIITTVKRENQMMHNTIANCPQTNARPLFPNPYQLLFKVVSSSLYSGCDNLWSEISVWLVEVTCPCNAPPHFLLCTSSLAEDETRKKSLT